MQPLDTTTAVDGNSLPAIGIIGAGSMAAALVDGIGGASHRILLSPRGATTASSLAERHVNVEIGENNQFVVDNSKILIISVRPDQVSDALSQLTVPPDVLVISVVAGVTHEQLALLLGDDLEIVLTTPQISVRHRACLTPMSPGHPLARRLFDILGGTLPLENRAVFQALQVPAATMSTLLGYLLTITEWTERQGVTADEAEAFVKSLAAGAVRDLSPKSSLSEALAGHETPGGLNAQVRNAWLTPNTEALHTVLDGVLKRIAEPSP